MSSFISSIKEAQVISTVFGNGYLGQAVTGTIRIPAFQAGLSTLLMASEVAIRALRGTLAMVNIEVKDDSWIEKTANSFVPKSIRPYKNEQAYPTKTLLLHTLGMSVFALAAHDFVSLLGGTPPSIYNKVLTLMGPFRIDTRSCFETIPELLRNTGWLKA